MKTRSLMLVILLASACFMPACPRENSCNVLTPGLFCNFDVSEEDGIALAKAVFSIGGPAGTELSLGAECGDEITVNGVPLMQTVGLFVYYQAEIPLADTYEFVFTRGEDETYTCTVSPPPEMTITAPAEATVLSRLQPFDIMWDANYQGSPGVNIAITLPCGAWFGTTAVDNGLYTVNAGTLQGQDETTTCDAQISLSRVVQGQMDAGLEGVITARTIDRTWFTSAP